MPPSVILDLARARPRRTRAQSHALNRRVVTARLYAAWHVGRARYLIALCEQSVSSGPRHARR